MYKTTREVVFFLLFSLFLNEEKRRKLVVLGIWKSRKWKGNGNWKWKLEN